MFTRAYYTIAKAVLTPVVFSSADFSTSELSMRYLNCKDTRGNIRSIMPVSGVNTSGGFSIVSVSVSDVYKFYEMRPFSYFMATKSVSTSLSNGGGLMPDTDDSEPAYEDFSVANSIFTGTMDSVVATYTYDEDTDERVFSTSASWSNGTGSAQTVYGIKVIQAAPYRNNQTVMSPSSATFLICREKFDAPVTVPADGIIKLTFTWRVGAMGVTDPSASATL